MFKNPILYLIFWIAPFLSAIIASFIRSIGLGLFVTVILIVSIMALYFYIKSFKIKTKEEYIIIKKGRIISKSTLALKKDAQAIEEIKTPLSNILKASTIILYIKGYKLCLPLIEQEKAKEIKDWLNKKKDNTYV